MDQHNLSYLNYLIDNHRKTIYPISKYSPSIREIEDPWYSGEYDLVIQEIIECLSGILKH